MSSKYRFDSFTYFQDMKTFQHHLIFVDHDNNNLITLLNPHCSPQMESMSLTTRGQGLLQPLEGVSTDEHWRSETAFTEENSLKFINFLL